MEMKALCARSRRHTVCVVLAGALAACGGGGSDTDAATTTDRAAEVESGNGYELPDDYSLPTPDGGTLLTALFDDTSGTSNITISYPSERFDDLIEIYDTFFDGVSGETMRVPPADRLASWLNETSGYSVIVNGQNQDVQVRLQTGI